MTREQMRFCAGAFGAMCLAGLIFGLFWPLAIALVLTFAMKGRAAPWMSRNTPKTSHVRRANRARTKDVSGQGRPKGSFTTRAGRR